MCHYKFLCDLNCAFVQNFKWRKKKFKAFLRNGTYVRATETFLGKAFLLESLKKYRLSQTLFYFLWSAPPRTYGWMDRKSVEVASRQKTIMGGGYNFLLALAQKVSQINTNDKNFYTWFSKKKGILRKTLKNCIEV